MVSNAIEVTRESVLQLIENKNDIEKSLKEFKEVLDANRVGMTDELVDGNGFPRQDIDVYQVRHARHQIICLQNDHKSIMKDIEQGLHAIHAQSGETAPIEIKKPDHIEDIPIARVDKVDHGSPAEAAGLLVNDLILEFGTVKYSNFKSLQEIGSLVVHSVGRTVPLIVKRNGAMSRLSLVPKEWDGKGYLGCHILAIENVER